MDSMVSLRRELEESRAKTDLMFGLVHETAWYERPIPERHRLIFYLGHLETFDWNHVCRWTLGMSSFHPTFDQLFEAGIDPSEEALPCDSPSDWPSVEEVRHYGSQVRDKVDKVIGEAPETVLQMAIEHRLMHAETNAYLVHHLDGQFKRPPAIISEFPMDDPPEWEMVEIPEGMATLGQKRDGEFGWDNEFSRVEIQVPSFSISRYKITNHQYLRFVREGGEVPPFWVLRGGQWLLRTMFQEIPLPLSWPVFVTHRQAQGYADWIGMSLPSEAQFHRAAYGTPNEDERLYPWGDDLDGSVKANVNFHSWNPMSVTTHPEGESPFGVAQLVGNGWEWTSTRFSPFEGFSPFPTYPGYSARFFDKDHFVVKGAGPFTAQRLLRRSFRNWFRQGYSHAHTSFRCVQS